MVLIPHLLPNGPAVDIPPQHRPVSLPIDPTNVSLRLSSGNVVKIYERIEEDREPLLIHPETIVFDNQGTMYIMNENAQLVSITDIKQKTDNDNLHNPIYTAKTTEIADLGVGRPLGGKFDMHGCLYFADALQGLARICLPSVGESSSSAKPVVELIASRVRLEDGTWSPINYANDVDIGPKSGHIYFTDSSDIKSDRDDSGLWDTMYASKLEGVRGKRTGRLLRFIPDTGKVDVLATDVAYANGVAVNNDETYILYVSTFECSVMKYHLNGEGRGPERILDQFTGFLDGLDCSFQRDRCYVAIPSAMSPVVRAIFSLPSLIGIPIRSFLMMIPRTLTVKAVAYGGVAEIYAGDGINPARIVRLIQDPDGTDINMITGVTEHLGKLYLGSLHNNYVSVLTLEY